MIANTPTIKTIGVYGSTEESFFSALKKAGVDTFCDLRQRRAVRGSKYAYVNATRLQEKLKALGIRYVYIKELAPTSELRQAQKEADASAGIQKRDRRVLSEQFVQGFQNQNLKSFSAQRFLSLLPDDAKIVCLFCVEREPEACHRSLVAKFIAAATNASMENLMP